MDGFARRLTGSLQFRLALALALAVTLVALGGGGIAFVKAHSEANALQDDTLYQVAALAALAPPSAWQAHADKVDTDDERRLHVLQLGAAGAEPALPPQLGDGLHTAVDGESGDGYRVLVRTLPGGVRLAVAQETELRDEAALAAALHTVLPLLLLAPLLWLLVAVLVYVQLRPVTRLAREVAGRDENSLHPLPDNRLPREVRGLVEAVNRLLGRVAASRQRERRFVADAAHELRTPLTALSLQAERLGSAELPPQARERLVQLQTGIARNRHLLEQLLGLARAQQGGAEAAASDPVSLVFPAFRRVLEELLPLAEAKALDVGLDEATQQLEQQPPGREAAVRLDAHVLHGVLKNLLDNAIRYTPEGGQVDIACALLPTEVMLEVRDTGPGIAEAERERVLDAFYRIPGSQSQGSGLGLAIVNTWVMAAGGRLQLDANPAAGSGLRVRVWLPRAPLR